MGETSKDLLKRFPAEKCWALTTKILQGLLVLSGSKNLPAILGTEDGFISPVRGWEKHEEVTPKIYGEIARKFFPWVEKMFSIPVEDIIGVTKLYIVATTFLMGPEFTTEIIETTKEKIKIRVPTCGWTERFNEHKVPIEFRICYPAHNSWAEEGLKAINPKIIHKFTKSMGKGDPFCEIIIQFKEE
ncbi:hypothetical protein [Candidatus Borrarchaeum sp.]|uniref:hypothetical protein n=1 Tax=Candidatus Borrarchaeum sp. TaxID=2846742 RepID=UPI00257F97C4|nr:hypothetical protein [Candidatus Borrarchaeum sp.]